MTALTHRLAQTHRLLPAGWSEAPAFRAGARLVRKLGVGLQAVQYAQMVSVLNRLPDTCLNEAGLPRHEIPEHARRTIYRDAAAESRPRQ